MKLTWKLNSPKDNRLSQVSKAVSENRDVMRFTFKTFPPHAIKNKKESFIINGRVLTFPAGLFFFCLLKAAAAVSQERTFQSLWETTQCNEPQHQAPERDDVYIAGPETNT